MRLSGCRTLNYLCSCNHAKRWAGEPNESVERLDLREVVSRSVAELHSVAADKGIELVACLGEEAIAVLADRATIELVTDNLVDNAIKYTGAGGRIEVRTACRDGEAILEVEDSGVGSTFHVRLPLISFPNPRGSAPVFQ